MDISYKIIQEATGRIFSDATIRAYSDNVKHFLVFFNRDVKYLTKKDVIDYLNYLSYRNLSGSTMCLTLSSIKFMLNLLKKNWHINILYSKT